jgi:hypothetical protein
LERLYEKLHESKTWQTTTKIPAGFFRAVKTSFFIFSNILEYSAPIAGHLEPSMEEELPPNNNIMGYAIISLCLLIATVALLLRVHARFIVLRKPLLADWK